MPEAIFCSPIHKVSALLLLLISLLFWSPAPAGEPVGIIKYARGDVTIEASSGKTRKARKNELLQPNELVVTGAESLAVIELSDKSRMTLRPNSSFRVSQIGTNDNGEESAILNLLRGGLRLVTGLIAQINPAGYRLNTPVATIGIRGTDFNTRICGADCALEEALLADKAAASKIKEGLYVNMDDGATYMQNFASNQPVDLVKGEAGFVADLNTAPAKLDSVPAFQALDKVPSPSQLDFNNLESELDDLDLSEASETETTDETESADTGSDTGLPSADVGVAATTAAGTVAATTGDDTATTTVVTTPTPAADTSASEEINIAGNWETADEIEYGKGIPRSLHKYLFGGDADLEFEFEQKGDKFTGEFDGKREGTMKGRIDDNMVYFTFVLEAKGGELKEGDGTWTYTDEGTLEGDWRIRDREWGIVRGRWILVRE